MSVAILEESIKMIKADTPENHKYLLSKGWKDVGSDHRGRLWNDPRADVEMILGEEKRIKTREGKVEVFRQAVLAPCRWDYTTSQALHIQKDIEARQIKIEEPAAPPELPVEAPATDSKKKK